MRRPATNKKPQQKQWIEKEAHDFYSNKKGSASNQHPGEKKK